MLEAVFRVVTPLFLGGADGKTAEIRAASLKGALRFWYRATSFNAGTDIKTIRDGEAEIFGSSEKGQSSFLIDVVEEDTKILNEGQKWEGDGISYLGYGLINFRGIQTERRCISHDGSFRIRLYFRGKKTEQEAKKEALLRALTALNYFGGLGSRSRRGFGSLTLESLLVDEEEKEQLLADVAELQDKIKEFCRSLGKLSETLPPYTAFSSQSRIVLGAVKDSPLLALDEIGKELIRYRSYGRKEGKTGRHILPWREAARQNFKGDHDLVRDFAATGTAVKHPERVVFGLPHNYYFGDGTNVNIEGASEEYQRRASPLFIHIHKLKEGYVPVLTFLPAVFLPAGGQIVLKDITRGRRQQKAVVPCTVGSAGYKVITDFLNRLPGEQEVRLS